MNHDAPLSEINVTNLVDVMLVLLVLFMITAPLLKGGLDVDLPETRAARPLEGAEGVTVTIRADGIVKVDDVEVPESELAAIIEAKAGGDHPAPIYLLGDTGADYGKIVRVLGILQEAGIDGVGLVAAPEGVPR